MIVSYLWALNLLAAIWDSPRKGKWALTSLFFLMVGVVQEIISREEIKEDICGVR